MQTIDASIRYEAPVSDVSSLRRSIEPKRTMKTLFTEVRRRRRKSTSRRMMAAAAIIGIAIFHGVR